MILGTYSSFPLCCLVPIVRTLIFYLIIELVEHAAVMSAVTLASVPASARKVGESGVNFFHQRQSIVAHKSMKATITVLNMLLYI